MSGCPPGTGGIPGIGAGCTASAGGACEGGSPGTSEGGASAVGGPCEGSVTGIGGGCTASIGGPCEGGVPGTSEGGASVVGGVCEGGVPGSGDGLSASASRITEVPSPLPPAASPPRRVSAGRFAATAPDTKLMNAKIARTRIFILPPSSHLSAPRRITSGVISTSLNPRLRRIGPLCRRRRRSRCGRGRHSCPGSRTCGGWGFRLCGRRCGPHLRPKRSLPHGLRSSRVQRERELPVVGREDQAVLAYLLHLEAGQAVPGPHLPPLTLAGPSPDDQCHHLVTHHENAQDGVPGKFRLVVFLRTFRGPLLVGPPVRPEHRPGKQGRQPGVRSILGAFLRLRRSGRRRKRRGCRGHFPGQDRSRQRPVRLPAEEDRSGCEHQNPQRRPVHFSPPPVAVSSGAAVIPDTVRETTSLSARLARAAL